MNMAKAPAGGMTSKVNGQFYDGGEFMPVSGLFCGKAGLKRCVKWEKAKASNIAKDLGGNKMFEVTEYLGNGVFQILGYAIANTNTEAAAAFIGKSKTYAKKV